MRSLDLLMKLSLVLVSLGILSSGEWFVKSQDSREDLDDAFANLLDDPYNGYEANEVINKSPTELLKLRGYDAENHYATTKDGYKINIVRVVNKALPKGFKLKRPVLFTHGPLNSATIWLINSRNFTAKDYTVDRCKFNSTLPTSGNATNPTMDDGFDRYLNGPMMLSNAGHDVWLMSLRGTEYSQNNTKLNSSDPNFWDFSYDETVSIDLPAVLELIMNVTKSVKIGYVGHSQGGFAILALMAIQPNYADCVEPVVLVSPGLYFGHITSSLRGPLIVEAATKTDNGPFPPNAKQSQQALGQFCAGFKGATTCTFAYAHLFGLGKHWPRGYFTHTSYESSRKVSRHIGQLILSNEFQMYDYGSLGNLLKYDQQTPPRYPIENIRSKSLCFFTAEADAFSTPIDNKHFERQLKVPLMRSVQIGLGYNFFDLITSQDAGNVLFKQVLDIFNSFDGICASQAFIRETIDRIVKLDGE